MKTNRRADRHDVSLSRSHSPLSNVLLSLLCTLISVAFCGGFLFFGAYLAYEKPIYLILFAADLSFFLLTVAALCRFRR